MFFSRRFFTIGRPIRAFIHLHTHTCPMQMHTMCTNNEIDVSTLLKKKIKAKHADPYTICMHDRCHFKCHVVFGVCARANMCELNIPLIYHFSHNIHNDVYLFCFNLRRSPLNGTTVRLLFTVKFS